MTDIAQLEKKSHLFLAPEEEQRLIRTWRLRAIAFYGSLLALLIVFAAMSQAPR
ncbi:hypothetical protein [Bradyrhizobium sp. CSS354]|uniref:hypothetical protein n=1 Tax=Bradyrhizobium sp. CSS354 TaxID=2699172 RepID=UPI0023B165D7|nr:hypothetical protein [Bradyrhizobium sp. CSS354]MDE5462206.1 hypothetical protein [Bradyrhizobium sp. CSS354]